MKTTLVICERRRSVGIEGRSNSRNSQQCESAKDVLIFLIDRKTNQVLVEFNAKRGARFARAHEARKQYSEGIILSPSEQMRFGRKLRLFPDDANYAEAYRKLWLPAVADPTQLRWEKRLADLSRAVIPGKMFGPETVGSGRGRPPRLKSAPASVAQGRTPLVKVFPGIYVDNELLTEWRRTGLKAVYIEAAPGAKAQRAKERELREHVEFLENYKYRKEGKQE